MDARLSKQEIIELFKKEYDRIQPNTAREFSSKRSKELPTLATIKRVYNLTYSDMKALADIDDSLVRERKASKRMNEIVLELKNAVNRIGRLPTAEEFEDAVGIPLMTAIYHFKSYNNLITAAGFTPKNKTPIDVEESTDELLQIYISQCKKAGRLIDSSEFDDYELKYSCNIYTNRFGSFGNLKYEANKVLKYPIKLRENRKFTKDELTKRLLVEYQKKGRKLTYQEIIDNPNLPSPTTYLNYFKTTKITDVWKEVLGGNKENNPTE